MSQGNKERSRDKDRKEYMEKKEAERKQGWIRR